MAFKKLAETTIEIGKHKSKLTFRPLGAAAMSKVFDRVDLKNLHKSDPSLVSGMMVEHIVKLDGISDEITEAFLLKEFPMFDFWDCLTAMVDAAIVKEDQAKNSGSPSE